MVEQKGSQRQGMMLFANTGTKIFLFHFVCTRNFDTSSIVVKGNCTKRPESLPDDLMSPDDEVYGYFSIIKGEPSVLELE